MTHQIEREALHNALRDLYPEWQERDAMISRILEGAPKASPLAPPEEGSKSHSLEVPRPDPDVVAAERMVINVARGLYSNRANANQILDYLMPKLWYAVECLMDAKGVPRFPLEAPKPEAPDPRGGGHLFHEALEAWKSHYETGDNDGVDVYEANAASYEAAKSLTERYFANIPALPLEASPVVDPAPLRECWVRFVDYHDVGDARFAVETFNYPAPGLTRMVEAAPGDRPLVPALDLTIWTGKFWEAVNEYASACRFQAAYGDDEQRVAKAVKKIADLLESKPGAPQAGVPALDLEALEAYMVEATRDRPNMADLETAGLAWLEQIRRLRGAPQVAAVPGRECWGLYSEHGIVMWQEHQPSQPADIKPGFEWVRMVEARLRSQEGSATHRDTFFEGYTKAVEVGNNPTRNGWLDAWNASEAKRKLEGGQA